MKLRKIAAGVVAVVGMTLAGSILTAAPANAATSCYPVSVSNQGTATATCYGNGPMRFVVSCNATWPAESWTKRSAWITVTNGGQNVVAYFPACYAPMTVSAEY